jgi:hypothetical protein
MSRFLRSLKRLDFYLNVNNKTKNKKQTTILAIRNCPKRTASAAFLSVRKRSQIYKDVTILITII